MPRGLFLVPTTLTWDCSPPTTKKLWSSLFCGTVGNSSESLVPTRMVSKNWQPGRPFVFNQVSQDYQLLNNLGLIIQMVVDMLHQSTSAEIIWISECGWFFLFSRRFVSACRNNILHCYCYGSISGYIFSKLFQRGGYSHKSGCKHSKSSNVFFSGRSVEELRRTLSIFPAAETFVAATFFCVINPTPPNTVFDKERQSSVSQCWPLFYQF